MISTEGWMKEFGLESPLNLVLYLLAELRQVQLEPAHLVHGRMVMQNRSSRP